MSKAAETFHHDIADRHDKVLIVDFGSQVTQLIARRVREAGVYCANHPFSSCSTGLCPHSAKGCHPFWRTVLCR